MSVALDFMHNSNSVLRSSATSPPSASNYTSAASNSSPTKACANCNTVNPSSKVNGCIAGDNKTCKNDGRDYVILKATVADSDDILNFMLQDFLFTEPLNQALDVRYEDAADFFAEIIRSNLADGLSYIVREKRVNTTGEETIGRVVAVRLSSILNRPSEGVPIEKTSAFAVAGSKNVSSKIQKIERFLEEIESKAWEILPATYNRLLTIVILSVDKNFTRRGIAAQLINYNLDEIRAAECQGIVTEATAFNSQQLFSKHNYNRLYEIRHVDWLDADDQQIFRCQDRTQSATLEFMPL